MPSKKDILNQILSVVTNLQKEMKTMADSQVNLDVALTAVSNVITNVDAGITALIAEVTALIAKVQGGANPADLTTEGTALNSMATDLSNQVNSIQASIAAAKPVTGV